MQWLKKLFCRHEYTYVRKTSGRICIQYKKCDKCGTNSREEILPIIHLKKKYNFSIVKGMAEAARLYKKYYEINTYKLENYHHSLAYYMYESAYDQTIKGRNLKEYEIKCMAAHDSYIDFNEKKEKEEEIEKFYLSKINDCYLWLKHN